MMDWRIQPIVGGDPPAVAHALRERIKELNCLYGIAQLIERNAGGLDELLQGAVNLIPPAWQHPEVTCARIVFQGKTFVTPDFEVTPWQQSASLYMQGQAVGEVAVFYREDKGTAYEGPFLREERALLDAIAQRLGAAAMSVESDRALQETNRQLTVERKALRETNIALRTVLARIEEEKQDIYRRIQDNVQRVLGPILNALTLAVDRDQRKYVDLLRDSLDQITSPFVQELSTQYRTLSPTELQICTMIRGGLRSKEIAAFRGVAVSTVNRHREHIRRKLGLANEPVNLTTYLQTTLTDTGGSR